MTATADQGRAQTIRRIARDNPRAQHRRHRLLRDAAAGRSRARCPNVDPRRAERRQAAVDPALRRPEEPQRRKAATAISAVSAVSSMGDGPCGAAIEPGVAGRTAFTLRVQTGCAEACSYCIIPTTRGTPRSVGDRRRSSDEVERVAAAGFKEIASDRRPPRLIWPRSRASLVAHRAVARWLDDWVRGNALEPTVLLFRISFPRADGLLARTSWIWSRRIRSLRAAFSSAAAAREQPCPGGDAAALHDRVLRGARRRHPRADPDASIGSDIIVGFPGETDDDFEQLAAYLERSPLTHIHVFPYSDRPGHARRRR